MSEARTAAGRALLAREAFNERSFALIRIEDILAIEAEARSVTPSDGLREALAEGLHKAMCFGPSVMHNRLACERPAVYLALAEAALNHPAVRDIVGAQQRSTEAAFGALDAVAARLALFREEATSE